MFFFQFPSKEEERIKIASDFKAMSQFENCTGAVDLREWILLLQIQTISQHYITCYCKR